MSDDDLTQDELNTLALFQSSTPPADIDPHHFAKLLSMALIEQKEGGAGIDQLWRRSTKPSRHARGSARWGYQMNNGERVFYTSENGDRWLLLSGEDIVSVRHVPNAASGGESKTYELGGFLIEERHSAQNQALRALISSLTRTEEGRP